MNAIQVQCEQCKRRFAAKPKLAGKRVKCPGCQSPITIPDPDVIVATAVETGSDSLFDASDAFESTGDSVFDDVSTQGASPFASSPTSGAPRQSAPFGPSSPSLGSDLFARHWPSLVVATIGVISCVLCLVAGYTITGAALFFVGLAVAGSGFLFPPRKRRKSGGAGLKVASSAGGILFFAVFVISKILGGIGEAGKLEGQEWVVPVVAGLFGLAVVGGLLIVFVYFASRFGIFRAGSVFYIFAALAIPVFLMSAKPGGGIGGGGQLARKEPPKPLAESQFPNLGSPRSIAQGVDFYEVRLRVRGDQPGHASKLYVYLPQGSHRTRSLPCVFIASAGARTFTGMDLGQADQPEHIPYAQAGFAVVAYEIDGCLPDSDDLTDAQFLKAMNSYWSADAGLVNARNAIDFALAKVPAIDPQRLYAAGHSSAATQSVLLAEKESRIRGCIAYAGVFDIEAHLREDLPILRRAIDDFDSLLALASPKEHESSLRCPVFLFHALDDQVIPASESINMERRLRTAGKNVTLVKVGGGGHYDSMISAGIPKGVAWLQELSGHQSPTAIAASESPGAGLATNDSSTAGFGGTEKSPFAESGGMNLEGGGADTTTETDGSAAQASTDESPFKPSSSGDASSDASMTADAKSDESPFEESPFGESPFGDSSIGDSSSGGSTASTAAKPDSDESPFKEDESPFKEDESPFKEMASGGSTFGDSSATSPPVRMVGEAEMQRLLEKITSTNGLEQRNGLKEIAKIDPDRVASQETREAVVEKLNELAIGGDHFSKSEAVKALGTWGDSSSVSVLIGILSDGSMRGISGDIYKALGRLKDPAAAIAVAERLGDFFDRDKAETCLRQMGPVAEDALIIIAPSTNKDACMRALRLLGDIGSEKCFEVLREAQRSRDLEIREAGKLALRKIRYRKAAEGEQEDGKK